ncbi:MAG: hypothetical protein PWQ17_297 [Anaerophaga sp.]|nr:hypothetical protein [Anaerophaga sp.]MDN5292025.1 hypothetical protein [Anaerophaga sp.]
MSTSMKRVIIICEGLTEKEFCKDVLEPFFIRQNISIQTPLIKKSGGGIVPWINLKAQIISLLKQDISALVTTLIDYYGIPARFNYPQWESAHKEGDKTKRMAILEEGMKNDIPENLRTRFLPYLQLHEFEGLLFCDINVLKSNFPVSEINDYENFERVFEEYPNPEEINDQPQSAPSSRLLYHLKNYDKVVMGPILAQETGLSKIREKCPRFNQWIDNIENYS